MENRNIYNDLILKLSKKYNLSDLEVERIVDSQFKVVLDTISNKEIKTLNLIYLGKFTPTRRRLDKHEANKKESSPDRTDTRGDYKESNDHTSN